jgi:hypothetical protein
MSICKFIAHNEVTHVTSSTWKVHYYTCVKDPASATNTWECVSGFYGSYCGVPATDGVENSILDEKYIPISFPFTASRWAEKQLIAKILRPSAYVIKQCHEK